MDITIYSFITDPDNLGIAKGTVCLWPFNTTASASVQGKDVYNYSGYDYTKYHLTSGIRTTSASTPPIFKIPFLNQQKAIVLEKRPMKKEWPP